MPHPFTLTQLSYFQAVARHESMTEAAARLNVSQSAVSTAMAQLERALGVQLFIRQRNRSVVLSAAGRRLAADVGVFLEHADALRESAQGVGESLSGPLSVGIFAPIAPFRLPHILAEFEARYPHVHVQFLEADLATLQKALYAGECEMALTYALGLGPGFETRLVDTIAPHVLVAADHPAAGRSAPVHLRDFASEPMIQLALPYSQQYYEEVFRAAGVTPYIRHRFYGYETVRSFVGQGHGYTVLNQRVAATTSAGGSTAALGIADDVPGIDVVLAWPERARLTRRAQAFAEVCEGLYRAIRPDAG
ncbi:LysR family transcriptional regulator [Sediminivirga luteola]|uniref:LysR family transcriptional regulator n=1 Tax=Sediminivirga luteola TaxID=1774748 RepID=A0A8J2TZU9_9MICO|nr:LysR family transcriptional regulator [Sediminivirga luteola]GGA21936.1 LysR family transcriptional regulator [Sediminivirga luteola]